MVEIWREIKKTAKYVVEWYNSIGFFKNQTYIVLVNPIMIIFINNTGHALQDKTYLAELYIRVFWQWPVEIIAP